jgi:hypothetical protein
MGLINIKQTIVDAGAKLVTAVGKSLDGIFTNDEERMAKQADLDKIKVEAAAEINRHLEVMSGQLLDYEKALLADVQNARSLQVAALQQNDLFSKRFLYYLASFIIISATAFGFCLFFMPVPEENKRMVEMFADVYLFAGALSVIYFFFGSSKSSHDRREADAIKEAVK